jgi:aryl-alcohol dehydrogenase-like predicted oxidoreductase
MSGTMADRLALGTVQFGLDYGISNDSGITGEHEITKILEVARLNGINTIDTAHDYGKSEAALGRVLNSGFDIITKITTSAMTSGEFNTSLVESLKNLRRDSVYGILVHNADMLINNSALWTTLQEFKINGKAKKIGYSLYQPRQLELLLGLKCIPDIIQVPYNFFDRRFKKYFTLLKDSGVEIHTRSVFLQGLFFVAHQKLPSHFISVKQVLKVLREYYNNKDKLAGWLLQYVLKEKEIDKVVFGVNTADQLIANLKNLAYPYSLDMEAPEYIPEDILMPNLWPAAKNK